MKHFRSALLLAALTALFSQQTLAADEVAPAKKRPPATSSLRWCASWRLTSASKSGAACGTVAVIGSDMADDYVTR